MADETTRVIAKLKPFREPPSVGQGTTREQWLQQSREALAPILAETDSFLQQHNLTRRTEGLTGYIVIEGKLEDIEALSGLTTILSYTLDEAMRLPDTR